MEKIYIVKHVYDEDGGFGDAVRVEEVLCGFASEAEAKAFVSKYEKPHVYDRPYADLWCGELVVDELPTIPPAVDEMWWLRGEES